MAGWALIKIVWVIFFTFLAMFFWFETVPKRMKNFISIFYISFSLIYCFWLIVGKMPSETGKSLNFWYPYCWLNKLSHQQKSSCCRILLPSPNFWFFWVEKKETLCYAFRWNFPCFWSCGSAWRESLDTSLEAFLIFLAIKLISRNDYLFVFYFIFWSSCWERISKELVFSPLSRKHQPF